MGRRKDGSVDEAMRWIVLEKKGGVNAAIMIGHGFGLMSAMMRP